MQRIAVYARVSTVEQAEKGYSLDTQLVACRQKAAELGARKVEEFIDDGYSGEFIDRPALARLRSDLHSKRFDGVIVYDPDRLARNLAHQLIITEEIENAGAQLLFVSVAFEQSPEGKLFYSIRGAISAYEKEKIKERSLRGKYGKAAKGKIIFDAKPYGYAYDKENSNYLIIEEEAAIIRQMYQWLVTERLGTAAICRRLNESGIPSPRAKKNWIVSTVYRLLTNPLYKGTHVAMRYRYEKVGQKQRKKTLRPENEWIEIPVPAVVDDTVWDAAQRQLKQNKALAKRNLKRGQLLSGLVYCGKCGRKMTIAYSGKADNPTSYYVCVSQRSNTYLYSEKERCDARRVPTDLLDEAVFAELRKLCDNPRLIRSYVTGKNISYETQNLQNSLARLKDRENQLSKQRDMILRWYRQQMISDQDAEQQLSDLRTRIAELDQNKRKLQEELDALAPTLTPSELAVAIQRSFRQDDLADEDKAAAIRAVLEKVTVERKDTTKARGSKPEIKMELKFL